MLYYVIFRYNTVLIYSVPLYLYLFSAPSYKMIFYLAKVLEKKSTNIFVN